MAFSDVEIFSKPMVVFIGPWSTGKSAIINYLLGTEYTRSALKTGAEPTSNSFNVILYGEQDQVIDGTQLAADWAFSSLQKFGQGFLDRLKGRKMNNPILRKVTLLTKLMKTHTHTRNQLIDTWCGVRSIDGASTNLKERIGESDPLLRLDSAVKLF